MKNGKMTCEEKMSLGVMLLATLLIIIAVFGAFGAPHFVTPEMTLRNGLTDAQYEKLWAMGRSPRVDPGTVRDLIFRSSRYENVTNWIGVVGKTNDFAKLVLKQDGEIQDLGRRVDEELATNAMLRAEIRRIEREVSHKANLITNEVNELTADIAESAELAAKYRRKADELRLFPTLAAAFRTAATNETERARRFDVRIRKLLEIPEN